MTKTAIAILNYNGVHYLEKFLPSFIKYSSGYELVIIDNASTDRSVAWLKDHYPDITCIVLAENYGFAEGYNQGLKQVQADYFAIVNSDIEVSEHWLDILVKFLDHHHEYVSVQPKIKAYHQPDRFEYAGAAGGFIDALGFPYCRGRIFETIEEDEGQYNESKDVFWTSGACMVIRSKDFFEAGAFDKDFFAHMEEIDLCWRLNLLGAKLACVPESVVYHVGGGTLAKSNPRKTYLNFRNGLTLLAKNLPWYSLWKIPVRMLLDIIAGLKFWKENNFSHLLAILRAHITFFSLLGKNISKRRQIRKKPLSPQLIHSKSIVFDYFFRGKKRFSDFTDKNQ